MRRGRLAERQAELPRLRCRIAGSPPVLNFSIFDDEKFHRHQFVGFSGGIVPTKSTFENSPLCVTHRDLVSFGDHFFHVQLNAEGIVQLAPNVDDFSHAAHRSENALHDRIDSEDFFQRFKISAAESVDVLKYELFIGFEWIHASLMPVEERGGKSSQKPVRRLEERGLQSALT